MKNIINKIHFTLYTNNLRKANRLYQKIWKKDFQSYLEIWEEIGVCPKYYTFWKEGVPCIGLR